ELDRDSKIDADFAHRFAQVDKGTFGVLAAIAHHNEVTATQHHLVQSKVLEMAAIGKVHIFVEIGRVSNCFREQWPYGISWSLSAPRFSAGRPRVPQPPAEAHIK